MNARGSVMGMALAALCGQGDRVVSSRALFGSCFVIVVKASLAWLARSNDPPVVR